MIEYKRIVLSPRGISSLPNRIYDIYRMSYKINQIRRTPEFVYMAVKCHCPMSKQVYEPLMSV